MASAFSHIAVPVAMKLGFKEKINWRLLVLCFLLSVAPDFDSIGFKFGIPYESQWGHRGFTHSIVFSILIGLACIGLSKFLKTNSKIIFAFAFLSTISHAVLDAFTNGGLGVAFFWPFNNDRYFFPWRVVEVSPISISKFFTERGVDVLISEAVYIWLPCLCLGFILRLYVKNFRNH